MRPVIRCTNVLIRGNVIKKDGILTADVVGYIFKRGDRSYAVQADNTRVLHTLLDPAKNDVRGANVTIIHGNEGIDAVKITTMPGETELLETAINIEETIYPSKETVIKEEYRGLFGRIEDINMRDTRILISDYLYRKTDKPDDYIDPTLEDKVRKLQETVDYNTELLLDGQTIYTYVGPLVEREPYLRTMDGEPAKKIVGHLLTNGDEEVKVSIQDVTRFITGFREGTKLTGVAIVRTKSRSGDIYFKLVAEDGKSFSEDISILIDTPIAGEDNAYEILPEYVEWRNMVKNQAKRSRDKAIKKDGQHRQNK